jgi:hypothetical protein
MQFEGDTSQLIRPLYDCENRTFYAWAAIALSLASVLLTLPRQALLPESHQLAIRPLLGEPFP